MCVKLLGDVGKKKFTKEFFLDLPEEAREKKRKKDWLYSDDALFNKLIAPLLSGGLQQHSLFLTVFLVLFIIHFMPSLSPFCLFSISKYLLGND